jgi:hypothetical protein
MVRYIRGANAPTEINVRNYDGDGSTTDFTITANLTVNKILVTLNGIVQENATDFYITGTTLTFGTAPTGADRIQITEFPI